jgi:hypothetical protein
MNAKVIPTAILAFFVTLPGLAISASANNGTYNVPGTNITIQYNLEFVGSIVTVNQDAIGDLVIPPFINGVPITYISEFAFAERNGLTSISLPSTINTVDRGAFSLNANLMSINVDPANPNYTSLDGVLYSKNLTSLVAFPTGRTGDYRLPDGVTHINAISMRGTRLSSLTLPESVTSLGWDIWGTISGPNIHSIIFEGNAPLVTNVNNDIGITKNATVYFFHGASGFTAPTWQGMNSEMIQPPVNRGVFGTVTPITGNRHRSTVYGELEFANGGTSSTDAFSHSLQAPLRAQGGLVNSPFYGNLTPNPWEIDDWVMSQFFGLVHFSRIASTYDGWVYSERFEWMRFVDAGEGNRFLWVQGLQTWVAVNPDGSFFSFDFGWLLPQTGSFTRYNSRIGMVTADSNAPPGWLVSDRFGFVWFARDGTGVWFYSANREEWIGITENGALWSTAENRFLP